MVEVLGAAKRVGVGEIIMAVGLTVAVFALPQEANSQSFNCAKATKTSEFAICNNEDLLLLDERMASIHATLSRKLASNPEKRKFSKNSRAWLKKRNACKSDFACLELRYRERIQALNRNNS